MDCICGHPLGPIRNLNASARAGPDPNATELFGEFFLFLVIPLFLTSQHGVHKAFLDLKETDLNQQPMTMPRQEGMAEPHLSLGCSEGSCELNIQVESFCDLTRKGEKNIITLGPNNCGSKAQSRKGGSGGCAKPRRLGSTRFGWSWASVPRARC